MLWLALRFPQLPLQAVGADREHSNALIIDDKHRVCALNKTAEQAGIRLGMKTSAVHALAETRILERDRNSENQLLQQLAAWAYRFTPYIKRYGDDCLLLEISSCLRLFGGIEALTQKLCNALNNKTCHYQTGMAHSSCGAWLLSHGNHPVCEQDSQAVFMQRIASVPLSYLPQEQLTCARITEKMNTMGFRTFGDLFELPSHDIGVRFGEEFLQWLQDLKDGEKSALPLTEPQTFFRRSINFSHPVNDRQLLEAPATHLLQDLVNFLVKQQLQTRQIDWLLYSPEGQVHSISIGAERIHSQKQLLLELTRIRFEQIRLLFKIERLELRCEQYSPVQNESSDMFPDHSLGHADINVQQHKENLVAKVQAHLGRQAVYQLKLESEHIPEQQTARVLPFSTQSETPARLAKLPAHSEKFKVRGPRPCWLFKRPHRIKRHGSQLFWRQSDSGKLNLVQGPERIEGHWWKNPSIRDYFIAEREDHVRYWVYHDWQNDHWYAQGVFA